MSAWGSYSHYYYEITNIDGKAIRIKLAFNSKNLPDNQRHIMDQIVRYYPVSKKDNWEWRTPFTTEKIRIENDSSQETIFSILDKLFIQIKEFESDLSQKIII